MSRPGAQSTWKPTVALLLVVVNWGATFTVVKEALEDASTLAFLALRFSLASVVLAIVLVPRWGTFHPLAASVRAGLLAGLALFGGYFFQTAGLRYTSAPNSAFITSLSVVAVPLLAAFVYRSVPRPAEVAGVALATCGLALLTLQGQGPAMGWGDLLTLGCAFCFGAHVFVLAHFAPRCSFEVLSLTQIGLTAVIALGSFWWAEPARIEWTARLWLALGVTGVLATALAFSVQTWAQKHLTPLRTALILAMEPVFAWITSYVAAGESLSPRRATGAMLILAGVLLAELKPSRRRTHPST
ncbi:MAG: DMT family transporter [Bryobacteraceae bacterium]|nr:DMT family transporter [Bryobacteraceae bacterium]